MRCAQHHLAGGPDGRCALCKRRDALHQTGLQTGLHRAVARGRDPWRRAAVLLVAFVAGVASLAVLLAVADTRRPERPQHAALAR